MENTFHRPSRADQERIDVVRSRSNDFQNQIIDQYTDGRLSRRGFTRGAVAVGFALPFVGFVLAACSPTGSTTGAATAGGKGGLLRAGLTAPGLAIDPLRMGASGVVALATQVGEYLAIAGDGELKPVLAESWSPNEDASVWTFKIREGVTFNDGSPLTAEDVAATFNRAADPESGSNALETLGGVLSPGGATAVDERTVVFELEGPNGAWPWLVSSDNTSCMILPKDYNGDFESTWIGTGPWKLEEYITDVRATFVRNEDYWGTKALADKVEFTLFADQGAMALGLQAKNVSLISGFSLTNGRAIVEGGDSAIQINKLSSSAHNPWNLLTTTGPLADKRVRRALALSIDRQQIVDGLLNGYGDVGNDSPFAPIHAATPPDAPQRERDVAEAKKLLAEAGYADGVSIDCNVWDWPPNAEWSQLAQQWAGEVGIKVNLTLMDTGTFLGSGEFGSSPQLDSESSIADWGSRATPDTFLTAQLKTDGVRNAAHWSNSEFDSLLKKYQSEPDLDSQRAHAARMQEILHDETPMIYPFFTSYLTANETGFDGAVPTPMGHLFVDQVSAVPGE